MNDFGVIQFLFLSIFCDTWVWTMPIALSVGEYYHSCCHINTDMHYTLLTVAGPEGTNRDDVIYYFCPFVTQLGTVREAYKWEAAVIEVSLECFLDLREIRSKDVHGHTKTEQTTRLQTRHRITARRMMT